MSNNTKKGPVKEMYSKARIAFNKELREHHPDIMMKIVLATAEAGAFEEGIAIGVAAAEFNIIMDGLYSREQIEHLYDLLIPKLMKKRQLVVVAGDYTQVVENDEKPELAVPASDIIH